MMMDTGIDNRQSVTGSVVVGDIRALSPMQFVTVSLFRDWFDGQAGRDRVGDFFDSALGPDLGQAATENWATFVTALVDHARRPVMRHGADCRCVGADEAVVAHILTAAVTADREDAMLLLSLLVPGEVLLVLIQYAERAGRDIWQISRQINAARKLH
ncbi:hypothetical protein LGQ03_05175 [Loktanella sp. TSTF-M6]|uniref:Uncharacterized protein n=1 Tax=Loktanella gaetbuli TaxID=2881335 RepID=A0ABS8BSA3_9RHOB|nr:hypothetical protein [Loktanella gaetbuli]MCB5198624.1 hypothetical protein [Loktanella gaetbuli]